MNGAVTEAGAANTDGNVGVVTNLSDPPAVESNPPIPVYVMPSSVTVPPRSKPFAEPRKTTVAPGGSGSPTGCVNPNAMLPMKVNPRSPASLIEPMAEPDGLTNISMTPAVNAIWSARAGVPKSVHMATTIAAAGNLLLILASLFPTNERNFASGTCGECVVFRPAILLPVGTFQDAQTQR